MKFETYAATPGLDRLPRDQRFAAYRSAHRQLKRTNAEYQQSQNQYFFSIIAAVVLPHLGWLLPRFEGAAVGVLAIVSGLGILFLAFRQQAAMNKAIGESLAR